MRKTKRVVATFLSAALVLSGLAISPARTTKAAEETTNESGSQTAAEALTQDVLSADETTKNLEEGKRFRLQKYVLANQYYQLDYFANTVLGSKNSKLKYAIRDIDNQNGEDLFVMNGKKLSIYNYTLSMMNPNGGSIDPIKTLKNVSEARVKSAKKGLFTVKTKSGKTTSYVTYKMDFDYVSQKTSYSVKGKTYKKGSKKITKKAFNKYVKSYKKLSKLDMTKVDPTWGSMVMYDLSDTLYVTKDLTVLDTDKFDVAGQDVSGSLVLRRDDGEDATIPYKAFGRLKDGTVYRFAFGADEAKGWNSLRAAVSGIASVVKPIGDMLKGEFKVVRDTEKSMPGNTVYKLIFNDEEGLEGDYYYEVNVDESSNPIVFKSVDCIDSCGVVEEQWKFLYGEEAEMDGEIYEPGLDVEAYGEDAKEFNWPLQ